MEIVGIISEFNPFHRGHEALLTHLRSQGAKTIVCAMSGNFVQRGDVAIVDKLVRAEMAVRCGADLALELPAPWAMATAEIFARGGVELLRMARCDTLAFGSESGDAAALEQVAEALEGEKFAEILREKLSCGITFASARQQAMEELLGEKAAVLSEPNNTLGVEYIRALRRLGAAMTPYTIRRIGTAHDGQAAEGIASASYVRELLCQGKADALEYLPPEAAELLRREITAGNAPVDITKCERIVLSKLRRMNEEEFVPYDGGGEGLYHRFYEAVRSASSLAELMVQAKTKRYPVARLRRMMMRAWLDLSDMPAEVPYMRVLAANEQGRRHLRQLQKAGAPILTKPADVAQLGEQAKSLLGREAMCTDQYDLCRPTIGAADREWRSTPRMI